MTDHPEQAPIFKRWRGWYLLLLVVLLAQILCFAWLTNHFS